MYLREIQSLQVEYPKHNKKNLITYDEEFLVNKRMRYPNHIVKWLPLYDLTKSKKWPEYNSKIYKKYFKKTNKN